MFVTIDLILLIMFDLTNTRLKMINTSEYGSKLIVHHFINDTKAMYGSKAQVGTLCDFQILAI